MDAAKRRAAAAKRRNGDGDGDAAAKLRAEEAAFAAGLCDACPRCGVELGGHDDEQRAHLAACADGKQIAAHAAQKAAAQAKGAAKADQQRKQDDAEALAAWQFMGAKSEQLWLLSESQLEAQCAEKGVSVPTHAGADKADLVAALVQSRALVASAPGSRSGQAARRRGRFLDAASLPDNLARLSLPELRAALAGHGFVPKGATKAEVLAEVAAELCGDADADAEKASAAPGRLTAAGEPQPSGKRARQAAVVEVDSESEDSAFDPEGE